MQIIGQQIVSKTFIVTFYGPLVLSNLFHQLSILLRNVSSLKLRGQRTSTNIATILTVELLELTHKFVGYESVKALKELSAQILVQEVYKSDSPNLVSLEVIPSIGLIKIEALLQFVEDFSQQSTHKCEIILIHWVEFWNVVVLSIIKVGRILFVH